MFIFLRKFPKFSVTWCPWEVLGALFLSWEVFHLFPLTAVGERSSKSFIDLGLLISIYPVSTETGNWICSV